MSKCGGWQATVCGIDRNSSASEMNILFIHGNYPGQFRRLSQSLGEQSQHDVRFLTANKDHAQQPLSGVKIHQYQDIEANPDLKLSQTTDLLIRKAQLIQQEVLKLRTEGFYPRLIIIHGGMGLGMLLKETVPEAALIGYFEWYFSQESAKLLLGNESLEGKATAKLRNLTINQEMLDCDAIVVPTEWQASQFPPLLRKKVNILFDGIDTHFFQPPQITAEFSELTIEGESGTTTIKQDVPLLTYATRGMEPIRGFPEFMRCLPFVLKNIPDLHVVIGGRDRSAYGYPAPGKQGSWKQYLLDELGEFSGKEQVVFTGLLNYNEYRKMLHRSTLHCYFTRGYVTSWSLFEAIACGTPIFTNINPATTGLLPQLSDQAIELDTKPQEMANAVVRFLRESQNKLNLARKSSLAPAFEMSYCMASWQTLINAALAIPK